jgi:ribosome-associated protein
MAIDDGAVAMIQVTRYITLDEDELEVKYIRGSGPGGQNVNKVASAAQLRFNVAQSPALSEQVKQRLINLAKRRINREGELIITARRYRRQDRNRDDAIERLIELIRKAAVRPTPRKKTKPTAAAKRRRLEAKKQRSQTKQRRSSTRNQKDD